MGAPITVGMMSRETLLWRCLHGGPLTREILEGPDPDGDLPWAEFRARNLPFLRNLTDTYGACAVVARSGGRFAGHLRFYPKAVRSADASSLGMCLQQKFPFGPPGDFGSRKFPPFSELDDKTLVVHCMMLAAGEPGAEDSRRKGIGTRMARALLDWAMVRGWKAVEATAYESLPVIYESSGQAGRNFWEKLGFRSVRVETEPFLEQDSEFVRRMREEARAAGLDAARLANRYIMRRDPI